MPYVKLPRSGSLGSNHIAYTSQVFAWTTYLGEEIAQGRAMADAAKAAGVGLLVWSSLISISERTQGRLTACVNFENKYQVGEYIKSLGIPATILNLGCFDESASHE